MSEERGFGGRKVKSRLGDSVINATSFVLEGETKTAVGGPGGNIVETFLKKYFGSLNV